MELGGTAKPATAATMAAGTKETKAKRRPRLVEDDFFVAYGFGRVFGVVFAEHEELSNTGGGQCYGRCPM